MDLPDLNQSRLSNSEDEGNFDFLDGSGKGFSDKNEDASATVDFFAAPTTSKKNEEEHFSLF